MRARDNEIAAKFVVLCQKRLLSVQRGNVLIEFFPGNARENRRQMRKFQ